jgi:PHD/YefM family antitoxin component YafN of YafNO toxin-antitoxin module
MKLSPLLALFAAAAICFAQDIARPPVVIYRATPTSKAVLIPEQDWSAMQKMSKAQFQQKLQELTDRMNQVGCPVVLTSAQMTPYLLLLKASPNSSDAPVDLGRGPGIDLGFRNASGKEIHSIALDAEFLAKQSIYDLRAERLKFT